MYGSWCTYSVKFRSAEINSAGKRETLVTRIIEKRDRKQIYALHYSEISILKYIDKKFNLTV